MITVRKSIPTKRFFWSFLLLSIFLYNQPVFADSLFDFNELNVPKKKSQQAAAIESYMERLYGSDITVGPGPQIVTTAPRGAQAAQAAGGLSPAYDAYLKSGNARNPAITLSFDASPISSFSVDSLVFKRGVGILIKADGVIVFQHLLTKAEKRSGVMESIDPVFFDKPIQTLEFIGINRSKIAIDNLEVNLSTPSVNREDQLGADQIAQLASVPEPSSLLMLGVGFLATSWLMRRLA